MISLAGMDGVLDENYFDEYDYIFCAGRHQVASFLKWRDRRPGLAGTVLIPGGYPKLDRVFDKAASSPRTKSAIPTVVYAPTHVYYVNEPLASLRLFGAEIVSSLLAAGFRVIFRPHPCSFIDQDQGLVRTIVASHRDNPSFVLDRSSDYFATFAQSWLLVTDLSGTGFTYSFGFERPAIFFAADGKAEEGLEGIQFESRERIGGVARSVPELIALARKLAESDMGPAIRAFRDEAVFNVGTSAQYLTDRLDSIIARRPQKDWVRL
jgi:CDP-glycerol glycerophosphotransferase (TagB/SpsB family)